MHLFAAQHRSHNTLHPSYLFCLVLASVASQDYARDLAAPSENVCSQSDTDGDGFALRGGQNTESFGTALHLGPTCTILCSVSASDFSDVRSEGPDRT